jgi:hypothetical protein
VKKFEMLFNALCNEIYIDRQYMNRANISSRLVPVYRPLKYRFNRFAYFLIPLLPLLLIVYFSFLLIMDLLRRNRAMWNENSNDICLVFSKQVLPILNNNVPKGSEYINFYQSGRSRHLYMSYVDKLCTYLFSIIYLIRYMFIINPKYWFNFIHIYEMLAFSKQVSNISKVKTGEVDFHYCNHFDRWAYIVSQCVKNRYLYQHGVVIDNMHIPYKMPNVTSLHLISFDFLKIFNDCIFLSTPKNVELLNVSLIFSNAERCNCLFIGDPISFYTDKDIVNLLYEAGVDVVYRPHPKNRNSNLLSKYKAPISLKDLPLCQYAICAYSTLGHELVNEGVNVFWYDPKLPFPHKELESFNYENQ